MIYATQNGWTKETMKARIRAKNKGYPSVKIGPNGVTCQYRAEDGNQCAAGCFIEDKDYDPAMENKIASGLKDWKLKFPLSDSGMNELQGVHDNVVLKLDQGRVDSEAEARGLLLEVKKINVIDDLCAWIDTRVIDSDVPCAFDNAHTEGAL